MARRVLAVALFLVAQSAGAQSAPRKLAVAGDSLSQAALADGVYLGDQPWNSWAYGTTNTVNSVLMRYWATLNPYMKAQTAAKDGATMLRDFRTQAAQICAQSRLPNRVFVLLGQNDACNSPRTFSGGAADLMPTAGQFRSALHDGLVTLNDCLPRGSVVHVVSVIRVDFLYEAGYAEDAWYCPIAWDAFDICPIVTQESDRSRRRAVGARIDEWNGAIAAEVADMNLGPNPHHVIYTTDWQGPLVIDSATDTISGPVRTSAGTFVFGSREINGLDCFHASTSGQRELACLEWARSLDGGQVPGSPAGCFQ
jgi:hypothetical protein